MLSQYAHIWASTLACNPTSHPLPLPISSQTGLQRSLGHPLAKTTSMPVNSEAHDSSSISPFSMITHASIVDNLLQNSQLMKLRVAAPVCPHRGLCAWLAAVKHTFPRIPTNQTSSPPPPPPPPPAPSLGLPQYNLSHPGNRPQGLIGLRGKSHVRWNPQASFFMLALHQVLA